MVPSFKQVGGRPRQGVGEARGAKGEGGTEEGRQAETCAGPAGPSWAAQRAAAEPLGTSRSGGIEGAALAKDVTLILDCRRSQQSL